MRKLEGVHPPGRSWITTFEKGDVWATQGGRGQSPGTQFSTTLPFTRVDVAAVTLAVCGAAGSGGRYVGRFWLSRIRRPVRWPFCGGGGSGGRYVGRFVVEADPAVGTLMAPRRVEKGGWHKRQISEQRSDDGRVGRRFWA